MSDTSEYATIRVRDSSGVSASIKVLLTGSIGDLRVNIVEAFDYLEDFDILLGYPPSVCKLPHDSPITGNISPNDCIRIQRHELSTAMKISKAVSSSSKSSIPAIASRSNSSYNRAVGFGARIMTFTGAIVPPLPTVGRNKKRVGNLVTTAVPKKQKKSIGKKVAKSGDGVEDICSALITAADGGAGGCSKALRSVFRKAVMHQYNDSLAVGRLRAAFAGRFSFTENLSIRVLGSGLSTEMDVSFPLKPECARSKVHVETVDLISVEMLRAILLSALEDDDGAGAAREFLKPVNMSKASPRIFWSLIKAFGPDISSAMSQLFPQVRTLIISSRSRLTTHLCYFKIFFFIIPHFCFEIEVAANDLPSIYYENLICL